MSPVQIPDSLREDLQVRLATILGVSIDATAASFRESLDWFSVAYAEFMVLTSPTALSTSWPPTSSRTQAKVETNAIKRESTSASFAHQRKLVECVGISAY